MIKHKIGHNLVKHTQIRRPHDTCVPNTFCLHKALVSGRANELGEGEPIQSTGAQWCGRGPRTDYVKSSARSFVNKAWLTHTEVGAKELTLAACKNLAAMQACDIPLPPHL